MTTIERRIADLEKRIDIDAGPWCPECGDGRQLVILRGDEPEPVCSTCGRAMARGEGVRVIRITEREDGPR